MAVPILMVVFVLAFIGAIIEYPVASILLHEQNNLTLAVGSKYFLYEQKYLWGDFAAAAILSGLPITRVLPGAEVDDLRPDGWRREGLTMRRSLTTLAALLLSASAQAGGSFADNPIVYFAVTDRFANGNPATTTATAAPPIRKAATWAPSMAATSPA
jgi:hypothetical protein